MKNLVKSGDNLPAKDIKVDLVQSEEKEGLLWENIYWGRSTEVAEHDAQEFEKFVNKSEEEIKKACFGSDGRLKHFIRAEHFDIPTLERLCNVANAARTLAKLEDKTLKSILTSKSVLNYFNQPSQRTFLSFSMAEAHLGMRREEVRDVRTSSFAKGETEYDALRTASSYFDAVVCRHPSDIYDLFAVWVMKTSDREIPVFNAGSGKSEHPTQGILDYYTIRQSFDKQMDGRTVIYVGDCKRGRTVHSLAKLMALHEDITAIFVAPEDLQIDEKTENYLINKGTKVIKETSRPLRKILTDLDVPVVVYMTRIQDEHGGRAVYPVEYKFTANMLDLMAEGSILMHPQPKREEIDPAIDFLKRHPKVMYWRQPRNGMWTRVADLAYSFGKDQEILDKYKQTVTKAYEIHDKVERNKSAKGFLM